MKQGKKTEIKIIKKIINNQWTVLNSDGEPSEFPIILKSFIKDFSIQKVSNPSKLCSMYLNV